MLAVSGLGEQSPVLSHAQGFKFLKVVRGPSSTTCFVEYEDIASAEAVHSTTQVGANIDDRSSLHEEPEIVLKAK